jgi:ATP-binding cassette subfamily C protein CydCD
MNIDQRLLHQIRSSRGTFLLTIGVGFIAGTLTVWQARSLSRVIGQVFIEGHSLGDVSGLLVLLLLIIILRAVFSWVGEFTSNTLAVKVKTDLRERLFSHLLDLGPSYAREERTGELVNVITEGIESLDAYFNQYLPQLALAVLVPLSVLIFIFPMDAISGVILLLTAPLIPIFMILIGNLAQAQTKRQWQSLSRMSAYFLDALQGLTTLKILGRSRDQIAIIARISDRYRETTMGVLRVAFLSALALELVSTLSTAVVAVEIGLRLLYGKLAFEQAFFILILTPEFYLPLRLLGTRFHAGMSGLTAAGRIFEILETGTTNGERRTKSEQTKDYGEFTKVYPSALNYPSSVLGTICFDDISYNYPDGRSALEDVSFKLIPNRKTALVGPSGAGKSTLASLLLRFIEPTQGQITINGQPLVDIPPAKWRDQVAWVSQTPYLYNDTAVANIRIARPEASLEEVIQAAGLAYADEFIRGLPEGYNTLIGERGARLSSGEAQRIALARAFLKNAPFLILDESTSNLDPDIETILLQAINRLMEGRTVLVIAHRLSTVCNADHIIVISEGRLVDSGTHQALMQRSGLYCDLVLAYRGMLPADELIEPPRSFPPISLSPDPIAPIISPLPPVSFPPPPFSPTLFLRLLSLLKPFTGLIILSVLLGFLTVASGIGLMTTSAFIIASAALHPSIASLQVAIVGVRFFGISRGLFRYLERLVSHQVTFKVLARLRVWFYQALEPLAPARLMQYRSGDLLSRVVGDIASLENFYVRAIAPPLVAVLVIVAIGFFMSQYDPSLAFILLIFLFLTGVGAPLLVRFYSREVGSQTIRLRGSLNVVLVDGIQGIADLLAFGQEHHQFERLQATNHRLATAQLYMARITGMQNALEILLSNLGMWTVLILAIPLVRSGQIDSVFLAVLTLAALTSFETMLPMPIAAQNLSSSLEAARRLFQIVDAESEVRDPVHTLSLPDKVSLTVQQLSFSYPHTSTSTITPSFALDDINFDLPQGKRLTIIGPSGSGKTTLVNLLLRFWDFKEGQILLGGQDIHRFHQDDLRHIIGVVTQNTYLFNGTVRDNLSIACPEASEEQIIRVAQQAQIHDFIKSLPQGYDTWIGEQGMRLSGGERQRLAVARALLKDAPLLILDEATANLDALNEQGVLRAIRVLMEGRTTLMVTHRLVGMEVMDEILVMQKGRVVERGLHDQLLKAGGLYRRLWDLQNQIPV